MAIKIANHTGLIVNVSAMGIKIGTIIYEISTKSIKKPNSKMDNMVKIIKAHLSSPGRLVKKCSTISSPPV